MIQEVRNTFRAGRTDVERAIAVLDEFMENLQEMPLILVDATHDTNVNRYKLFSFAVHDVIERGQ
ncbi:hypothetical protein PHMEG_00024691 [Phytophthora megakarya]|uniref:ZSWIM1/3 RNaseH-like domain-containing protein n=1 Tax=Phytophthora megakarya TaxID=4795 RepID=A0A225VF46_9STRA|nr:hypothetical protein PHMEG_00024691 [Phytophthora megakarya]